MSKNGEISSTERLLDQIRGNSDSQRIRAGIAPSSGRQAHIKKPFLPKITSSKNVISVGIDIGYTDLKLVKISTASENKVELTGYREIPFGSEMSVEHPGFPEFLKTALVAFCGTLTKVNLWCIMSSAMVEIRYLRIPKVPKKQVANAVYWTFKKSTPIDEKEQIFDFFILGELTEEGTEKIEVIAYTAPKQDINGLKHIFVKIGLPLTGITTVPFSFQNLLKTGWLKTEASNVCNLYIGRDWSRIDIFARDNLLLSRGIKAGTQSMIETLREELNSKQILIDSQILDSNNTPIMASADETSVIDTDLAKKLFFALIEEDIQPKIQKSEIDIRALVGMDITPDQLFDMFLPALDRLGKQVEKTLEHYTLNYGQGRVGKIYISGRLSTDRRIVDHIGNQLDLPRETVDPFHPPLPSTVKARLPEYESERSKYAPAVGIGLSNNTLTPNFIYTFSDKEKKLHINRINRLVMGVSLFLLVICMGFFSWQGVMMQQKKNQIARLQQELDQGASYLDQQFLQLMAAKIQGNKKTLNTYSNKYLGLSVITELCTVTPESIQLISLSTAMNAPAEKEKKVNKGKGEDKTPEEKNILNLDGIVGGDLQSSDAVLAEYVLKLKASKLFDKPNIIHQSVKYLDGKKVLRFSVRLEII